MLDPSYAGKDDNVLKYINKQKKVFSIPMESGVAEFALNLEWICSERNAFSWRNLLSMVWMDALFTE